MPKKQIELQVFKAEDSTTYKGRLLGLLSPEEYAALCERAELKDKILTVATAELSEVGKIDKIDDLRLVMTVKERDGLPVSDRLLFITEPLEYINSFSANKKVEVTMVGAEEMSYFTITEVDA